MYLGRDFPPVQYQVARIISVEMASLLHVGETFVTSTTRLRTLTGTDIFPENHLPALPRVFGSRISQMVAFTGLTEPMVGNWYALQYTLGTSEGRRLIPWARFQVMRGYGPTEYAGGVIPAAASSIILPAPPLDFTLPTMLGGYVGRDYPVANQNEVLAYGLDFAPALSAERNETISSVTSFLALESGTDPTIVADPNAYDSGGPMISGSTASRRLVWPLGSDLIGNVYRLNLTIVTSDTQAIAAWARIVIGRIG